MASMQELNFTKKLRFDCCFCSMTEKRKKPKETFSPLKKPYPQGLVHTGLPVT